MESHRPAVAAPLATGSAPLWYFAAAGERGAEPAGPIDAAALRALAASGVFSLDTLVWSASMAQWSPLRHVEALAASSSSGRCRAPAAYYETPPLLAVPAPPSLTSLPSRATMRFGGSPAAARYASPSRARSDSPYGALAGSPFGSDSPPHGSPRGSPRGSPGARLDPVLWHFEGEFYSSFLFFASFFCHSHTHLLLCLHFEDAVRGVRGTASQEAMQSMLARGTISSAALVWDATPRGWTPILDEPSLSRLFDERGHRIVPCEDDSAVHAKSNARLALRDESVAAPRGAALAAAARGSGRAGAPFGDRRVVATINDPASGVHFSALLVMAPGSATQASRPALLLFAETDADVARWEDVPKRVRRAFAAVRPAVVRLVASLGGARDAIVPAVRSVWSLGGAAPDDSPALVYTVSLLPDTVDVFDDEARAEVVALLLKFCARAHKRSGALKGLQ